MTVAELEAQLDRKLVVATVAAGDLSSHGAQELVDELTQRMRLDGAIHFVIDLQAVPFLDSAAVGSLVGFLQDLEHVRGRVALAGCQPNVAFLFKVTRLDSAIPLFEDVEEACEALTGS